MNDNALRELKLHVERAMRPVRVGLSRKRRIREELLAHVLSIYDEEFGKLGDEQKAVEQARRRFGEPREITAEARRSVFWSDRLEYWIDRLRLEPGESLPHLIGKHLLFACIVYVGLVLLVCLLLMDGGRSGELGLALHVFAVVGVTMWLFGANLVWMSNRLGRALHGGEAGRSWSTAVRYCLAALPMFPVATVLTYWGLGFLLPPPIALLTSGIVAPLFPAALVLMSRQAAVEIQHDEEWSDLEVD